ncbi:LacI family DNA-binding transcriptional regulator [Cellulomonas edaphi]|uniref:Substrate-binding domain-containing protein n=1 Tax=Cellulomonas edaphi TaxID=3053468 RepID=A0ABT7S2K9_9CELL|nr:substrate-binding domain-containing protein [Cellulomons edaphi]MDM7829859.1 substrate-binding domain-containing protein [Cellulomons edaphi]
MIPRTGAVGLVLARPARTLGNEPFFGDLIAGIEEVLATDDRSLLLHVVPDHAAELAAYRRWAEGGLVDAVVVVNVVAEDPRFAVLAELGIPAVVVGGPSADVPFSNVWIDNAQACRDAVDYLVGLGHRRLGRVSGPRGLMHTHARTEAFAERCARLSVESTIVEADYSEESGKAATRELLEQPEPPTAIIFDNDVMALSALAVTAERGVMVPGRLSVLAWDDSALCRLATPPLTAMTLDVHGVGRQAGVAVLDTLAGGPVRSYPAPPQRLSARGSTGRPAAHAAASV